jgi:hypothetical protein
VARHERGQAIAATVETVVLDRHVLARDEAFTKHGTKVGGAFRRAGVDESNNRHRLLGARREWQGSSGHAADRHA